MIERLVVGLVLAPIAALATAAAWLPFVGFSIVFLHLAMLVGMAVALPTTCIVVPGADAALAHERHRRVLVGLVGMLSGGVMAIIVLGHMKAGAAWSEIFAGTVGGLAAGLLFRPTGKFIRFVNFLRTAPPLEIVSAERPIDQEDWPPDLDGRKVVRALLLCGLAAFAFWWGRYFYARYLVPSAEHALRTSLAELGDPLVATAVTLHPDYCSVKGEAGVGWSVECRGLPLHHYADVSLCPPGAGGRCVPAPPEYTNCRAVDWNIDRWGSPYNPLGSGGKTLKIQDDCRFRATFAEDRERMRQLGIVPQKQNVFGPYSGATRLKSQ